MAAFSVGAMTGVAVAATAAGAGTPPAAMPTLVCHAVGGLLIMSGADAGGWHRHQTAGWAIGTTATAVGLRYLSGG